MKIPIIYLIPATMLLTFIYTKIPHLNFSNLDFLYGNSLVSLGVFTFEAIARFKGW